MDQERKRVTISVSTVTLAHYQRMADLSGMSLGKCIGDWLDDTVDSAIFVSAKMQEARSAPALVARELQGMAQGLVDMANGLEPAVQLQLDGLALASRRAAADAPAEASPRHSNTGGKSPRRNKP